MTMLVAGLKVILLKNNLNRNKNNVESDVLI